MSEPMTAEQIARCIVAEAVWAPSVNNTQPWRFVIGREPGGLHVGQHASEQDSQQLSLYADTGRSLAVADPDGRELMISCGAALFNVRLALRSMGYLPETSVLPDPTQPTLVARVTWRERAASDEFSVRCSARSASAGRTAGRSTRSPCRRTCSPRCAAVPHETGRRCASWRMTDGVLRSRPPWKRRNANCGKTASACVNSPDGRPRRAALAATECRRPPTRRGPNTPTRTSPGGISPAATAGRCRHSVRPRRSGRLGVAGLLTTAADRPADWVNAGQALQRIMLTASASGAAVALDSRSCFELPWLREFIRTQLSDGAYPHLMLRIGVVTQMAVSVRRDPGDVLFASGGDHADIGRG